MGLGTKIKSALNGDKTRDVPRKQNSVSYSTKAPTPPAKTPGAFPSETAPRTLTSNTADVNTAWNEPKPTHPQPHSTLRSPSPDYTFRTAESEAGFTDDVSQVSDFDDRTSIGETETPLGAPPHHNRLSKDPSKYPYWGAAGAGATNGATTTAPTAAPGATMTGTNNSSPRSGLTATMNAPSTAGAGHSDGHVKFSTAPQRQVGAADIYTGAGPTDSTYGELGNAGYDIPTSRRDTHTPRGMAPPIPEKTPGRAYTGNVGNDAYNTNGFAGNDAYNTNGFTGNDTYNTNGFAGTSTGTGLGMTNAMGRESALDRETKIAEYGAPTSSEHRRQASTSARGMAAAAMARRHRDDDLREYETTSPTQHGYNNGTQAQAYNNSQAQPHTLNTGAYTHPESHAAVGSGTAHERGAGVASPSGYHKHSPKDSGFGSGDDYSPASASTQGRAMPGVAGMGDGHFGPGHQGAKVVHRCHGCGVDNDISRYFRKEVVYRLGD